MFTVMDRETAECSYGTHIVVAQVLNQGWRVGSGPDLTLRSLQIMVRAKYGSWRVQVPCRTLPDNPMSAHYRTVILHTVESWYLVWVLAVSLCLFRSVWPMTFWPRWGSLQPSQLSPQTLSSFSQILPFSSRHRTMTHNQKWNKRREREK